MALDFGVEIECLVPGSRGFYNRVVHGVARDISEAGVGCYFEGYNHQRRDHWKIVTDASLSAPEGFVAMELVSPPLRDEGLAQIDTVCAKLHDLGARTNRSCGLHVHIGARHLSVDALRRLAFLYIENEDVIDSLMPPSRRRNNNSRYCASVKADADIARIRTASTVQQIAEGVRRGPSRFVKLNFTSYWKHGTVEFRQHSGTVDAEKIKRWVYFCQKMVDVAAMDQQIVAPTQEGNEAIVRRIQRARQLRIIFEAVSRPEGATSIEVQALLNRRTPPALASDLNRIGVSYHTDGRRNGHVVYKVNHNSPQIATLSALLSKLGLEEDHSQFWRDRAQLLASAEGVASSVARDENPNPLYRAGFTAGGAITGRFSASGGSQ